MLRRTLPAVQAHHPMKRLAAEAEILATDLRRIFTDCPERIDEFRQSWPRFPWQSLPASGNQ